MTLEKLNHRIRQGEIYSVQLLKRSRLVKVIGFGKSESGNTIVSFKYIGDPPCICVNDTRLRCPAGHSHACTSLQEFTRWIDESFLAAPPESI